MNLNEITFDGLTKKLLRHLKINDAISHLIRCAFNFLFMLCNLIYKSRQ